MVTFKDYITVQYSASEGLLYHINNNIPISENIFRLGSEKYYELFMEARKLYNEGTIELTADDKYLIEETDIGIIDEYQGRPVPLDCPMFEESETPPLNKPKRGGPKKFYVYVRGSNGKVKKVTWGDTTGLTAKINNPEARKQFAARHKCSTQKDRTKAAYWACNLPRYAKQLGMSGGGQFFW